MIKPKIAIQPVLERFCLGAAAGLFAATALFASTDGGTRLWDVLARLF